MAILRSLRSGISALGTAGGVQYAVLRAATKLFDHARLRARPTVRVSVAGLPAPVHLRVGGSDTAAFRQVFIERQYRHPAVRSDLRTIIDCGANIGLTSLWFLNHCPSCRVLAIEPEPGNAAMLRRNVAAFGDRIRVLEAAVWTERTRVRLHAPGRGREWEHRVEPGSVGEVPTLLIEDLLDEMGVETVDLLKIDVEGAEIPIFSAPTPWLRRVGTLLIELHGAEAERVVHAACEGVLTHDGHVGEIVAFTAAAGAAAG